MAVDKKLESAVEGNEKDADDLDKGSSVNIGVVELEGRLSLWQDAVVASYMDDVTGKVQQVEDEVHDQDAVALLHHRVHHLRTFDPAGSAAAIDVEFDEDSDDGADDVREDVDDEAASNHVPHDRQRDGQDQREQKQDDDEPQVVPTALPRTVCAGRSRLARRRRDRQRQVHVERHEPVEGRTGNRRVLCKEVNDDENITNQYQNVRKGKNEDPYSSRQQLLKGPLC